MIGDIVYVINRTSHTLIATKDSRQYYIPPGRSPLRSDIVPYAKEQNPIPGTEDPFSLQVQSLIAVEGTADPTEHIPDEVLDAIKGGERIDRSRLSKMLQRVQYDEHTLPNSRIGGDASGSLGTMQLLDPAANGFGR